MSGDFDWRSVAQGIHRLRDGRHIAKPACVAILCDAGMPGDALSPDRRAANGLQQSQNWFGGCGLAVGLALSSGSASAAEQRSAEDIVNALKAPRATRGLTMSPAIAARAADETRFIAALRNRPTRSLSTEEREKISSISSSKPKIDLEINFEFNSAIIGSKAMPQVTSSGRHLLPRT
jgi:hypothetical protein